MTAKAKRTLGIGTLAAMFAVLATVVGWLSGSFAKGAEYGELKGRVAATEGKNAEQDRAIEGTHFKIDAMRGEMQRGFERVMDKLDERTIGGTQR